MKKTMGKRLLSGATSALLAITYGIPSSIGVSTAAATNPDDGLPILDESYENSIWYRGGPLGVAGDFHIFAFDTATVGMHTNGNVAAPNIIGANASPNQYIGRLVSVAGTSWDPAGNGDYLMNQIPDIVLPPTYTIYGDSAKESKLSYPTVKPKGYAFPDGGDVSHVIDVENVDVPHYFAHWSKDFMDFEALETYYSNLSDKYAAKPDNAEIEHIDVASDQKAIIIRLNPEGENVINLTPDEIVKRSDGQEYGEVPIYITGLNLETYDTTYTDKDGNPKDVTGTRINGNQSLIINVDLTGYEGGNYNFSKISEHIHYLGVDDVNKSLDEIKSSTELNIKNGEGTVANGTNVLINFANAPEHDQKTDSSDPLKIEVGTATLSILAPDVYLDVKGTNGTFIAEDVEVSGETHMAYFMQPLSDTKTGDITAAKSWGDGNDTHGSDKVKVTLYRALEAGKDPATLEAEAADEAARYETDAATASERNKERLLELYNNLKLFDNKIAKGTNIPMGTQSGRFLSTYTSKDRAGDPVGNSFPAGMNFYNIYAFDDGTIGSVSMNMWTREVTNEELFKVEDDGSISVVPTLSGDTYQNTYWLGVPQSKPDNPWEFTYNNGNYLTIVDGKVVKIDGEPLDSIDPIKVEKVESVTLDASNNWKHEWKDMPKLNDSAYTWFYYIVEEPIEGYDTEYTDNGLVGGQDITIGITNSKPDGPTTTTTEDTTTTTTTTTTTESTTTVTTTANITIGKFDITDGKAPLSGATLRITSEDETIDWAGIKGLSTGAEFTEVKNGDKTIGLEWVSGDTDVTVMGLVNGEYTLHEQGDADGTVKIGEQLYEVITSDVKFTIENGAITKRDNTELGETYEANDNTVGGFITGANSIEINNAKVKSIKINKVVAAGEGKAAPADDATFRLFALDDQDLSKISNDGTKLTVKTDDEGRKYVEFTDNTAELTGLENGKYELEEKVAPDGYTTISKFTFEVQNGTVQPLGAETTGDVVLLEDGSLQITDQQSDVKINKTAAGGTPVDNAKFELTSAEGKDLTGVTVTGNATVTVDDETAPKTITIEGNDFDLVGLKDGEYTLKETVAPDGYQVVSEFNFTVDNGVVTKVGKSTTTGTVTKNDDGSITIDDAPSDIVIEKREMGGTSALPDDAGTVTYKLFANDGQSLENVTVDGKAEVIKTDETTGKAYLELTGNSKEFKGLRDGSYTLEETVAPTGFKKIEAEAEDGTVTSTFTFTIENGVVDENSITALTTGKASVKDGKLVVEDEKEDVISINKKVASAEGAQDVPASAGKATFVLTAKDAGKTLENVKISTDTDVVEGKKGDTSLEFTGNADKIVGLKAGKYSLKETVAPDGYTVVSEFEFTVDKDGKVTLDKATTTGDTVTAADGTITITDDISVITLDKKGLGSDDLTVEEITSGTAKFTLTALDENATLEGVVFGEGETAVTGAEGQKSIDIEGLSTKMTGLKDGKYSLEETAAPDGYTTVTKFTFEVENGVVKKGSVSAETTGETKLSDDGKTLTVLDKQSKIEISKGALGENGKFEALTGDGKATFKLTGADFSGVTIDGKAVTAEADGETGLSAVTFESNDAIFKGLKNGTYTLEETVAPKGYDKIEIAPEGEVVRSSFTFEIKDGKLVDGSVDFITNGDVEIKDGKITVMDAKEKSTITIDKKIASGGNSEENPSAEATFELRTKDSDKNLKGVTVGEGENAKKLTENDKSVEFTGSSTPITGLEEGTYVLKETVAPDGYTVVSEFEFIVDKDGKVTAVKAETTGDQKVEKSEKGDSVIITDDISDITVDKKALGAKEVLSAPEGAKNPDAYKAKFTLTVNDEGKTLDGVSVNGGAALEGGVTSHDFDGNSANFKGLKDGTYTLTETAAPKGYKVISSFTFTIENGEIVPSSISATTDGKASVDENGHLVIEDIAEDAKVVIIDKGTLGGEELAGDNIAKFRLIAEDAQTFEDTKVNDKDAVTAKDAETGKTYVAFD
ncbi:MAG: Cna B-type domain-containing protein [Ruminococcus sp.]|nr:Cna B-type domain-containing protein [Ruminococcus sp.]